MNLENYLHSLTPKIFKVLPMYEETDHGLPVYLERLLAELRGSTFTFPDLSDNVQYITIMNNLNYLLHYEYTKEECRRLVFDSISHLGKITGSGGVVDG